MPHHFRGVGEKELVALLERLNVTMAAAGDNCRNTMPAEQSSGRTLRGGLWPEEVEKEDIAKL